MKSRMLIAAAALTLLAIPAKADIKIGLTGALTGPLAGTYAPAVEGLKLYMDGVNGAGGINGENVELILLDDGLIQLVQRFLASCQRIGQFEGHPNGTCPGVHAL